MSRAGKVEEEEARGGLVEWKCENMGVERWRWSSQEVALGRQRMAGWWESVGCSKQQEQYVQKS